MAPKLDIEVFNGTSDFNIWRLKIKVVLVREGCAYALSPAPSADATASVAADFTKIDLLALSTLHLALSDDVLRRVQDEKTTASLWTKLELFYMDKSVFSKMHLMM